MSAVEDAVEGDVEGVSAVAGAGFGDFEVDPVRVIPEIAATSPTKVKAISP